MPVPGLTAYVNYLGGPEQTDSDNFRHLFDFVAIWKPAERLSFMLNYDHGTDEDAIGARTDASWHRFALYTKIDLTDHFSIAVRGEHFDDEDGVRTGVNQKLREITFTPAFKIRDNFVLRSDFRFDHSNKEVFEEEEGSTDNQTTWALNLLYFFNRKSKARLDAASPAKAAKIAILMSGVVRPNVRTIAMGTE